MTDGFHDFVTSRYVSLVRYGLLLTGPLADALTEAQLSRLPGPG
ncbi:MAG TPA: hypothetical protein VFB84_15165 [Micromonosporaceae bacterium]|nr:hypothetical protein [Micromonosporaceae bacterium]